MGDDHSSGREAPISEAGRGQRTGLVTLLFTDMVDSTAIKQQLGDKAGAVFFEKHHQIIRQGLHSFAGGREIETAGDSFLITLATPSHAVQFALLTQAQLRTLSQVSGVNARDRMGIHLGEVVIRSEDAAAKPKDLYGIQIDQCARVMSLAGAGQVLMTRAVFDSARQVLKGEDLQGVGHLEWLNHGPYLLKGLNEPVEICEVRESGGVSLGAPATSEKARRYVCEGQEQVLGWRPALGESVPNTKWVLERKLGEGGFGEVWLGRHRDMKERRVFKFCFRADRARSLKREMTLFRLIKERIGDHPNIVGLRNVYFDAPPFYVEMDYVEGKDLKSWAVDQGGIGRIPLELRLEIAAQAAEGLRAAHEAGVIHRDLKPANILVRGHSSVVSDPSSSGHSAAPGQRAIQVKLTDFGIGQVISEEYLAGITRAGFTQTMISDSSTSHAGTQLYMAPELLAGQPASTRSDIYSLGVVLYQMLQGDLTKPLTTDWAESVTDPLLVDDLRHCFAGNPQDRFADAGQLARSLRALPQRQAALREQQKATVARQRTARTLKLAGLAAASVLVVALALSLIWSTRRNSRIRWAREIAVPEITRLAEEDKAIAALALAGEAVKYIPTDPALTNLIDQISVSHWIETTPAGAEVYYKDYRQPHAPWEYLGKSPLNNIRVARGFFRFQVKLAGYDLL